MAILYDARGNEYFGVLDQIVGQTQTDARPATVLLAALNAETLLDLNGHATALIDLRTGAFNGTVVFEGTIDGTNYITIPALNLATQAYVALVSTTTTLNTQALINIAGYCRVRVRVSAYTSGNVTAGVRATGADAVIQVERLPMTLAITATGAAGAAVTLTIPSVASLFHYIDNIRVEMFTSAAIAAAGAAPTIVTTTNIPGTPSFNFRNDVQPAGQLTEKIMQFGAPLRSTASGTNTTVVCPATPSVLWRAAAVYRLGY